MFMVDEFPFGELEEVGGVSCGVGLAMAGGGCGC